MGKKGDLSDFECGMVVDDRLAGLSISETADLLGFSWTIISRVYREWSEKEKISSEWQLCGQKFLVDVRGQRRMDRLDRDDRKATVTQITTCYNQGMQNTISECTTRRTMKKMGYSSRRPHRGATPFSSEQKTETTIHTGSPKLNNRRLEKCCLI
uniref:Transposase Tc1-like domain-containing protein n=1 Tax=Pygocentrus nattereri TaxID=42514 RepID=A0AAR2L1M3_PYGNA